MVMTTSSPTPKVDLTLPGATAFSTLRGESLPSEPYSGFNACHYTGDNQNKILRCRAEAAHTLGLADPVMLILPRQTHTTAVAVVDSSSAALPLEDIDALVTADPSIAIGVSTADCVPILLSDPEAGIIAAIHSGWRGTVGRISARAVEAMGRLGADPSRIHAAIGPHIRAGAYEVGQELTEIFDNEFGIERGIVVRGNNRSHIDLTRAVRVTLADCGIDSSRIADCGICSCESYDRVFSARRLGVASGRTLTAVRLSRSKASM